MQIAQAATRRATAPAWPWIAVFGRTMLFIAMQALFALGLWLSGSGAAWEAAAAWWPLSVTLANLVSLAALTLLFRAEGASFWALFRPRRDTLRRDLLALLGVMLIAGPLGFLPNVLLAGWLFANPQEALDLLVRPLPVWAAYASLAFFPLTQGLAEIPTYFAYAMPRLEAQGLRRWQAVALPALMLGLQHVAAPLVFDLRFIAWRGLMFLPFALLIGIVLRWRPQLLPYIVAVHVLMDLSLAMMFL